MYNKLGGMTGTAVKQRVMAIYKLDVVEIPRTEEWQEKREDFIYKTTREKFNAVIEDVTELSKAGRPVLIGTTSVEISELLPNVENERRCNNVLNAKMHKQEEANC
jgi:preprotein translocase subunit SecA